MAGLTAHHINRGCVNMQSKHFRRRITFGLLLTTLLTSAGAQQDDCSQDLPVPTVSHALPTDVEIPPGFAKDPVVFFDDFSWKTFVALNWPAREGARGEPDVTKVLGAESADVVWGTWKADHEVFQPNGMPPTAWDKFEAASPDPFTAWTDAGRVKVLGGFGGLASNLQIVHYNQAGAAGNEQGALVDRHGRYLRYEVRINRAEFDFIREGQLYLAKNLPGPGQAQLTFPLGSIEIKAAWRVFPPAASEAEIARYYTVNAILVDPNGERSEARIGLVGLHIVHRTPTRREWIWSTFEHVELAEGSSPCLLVSDGSVPGENVLRPAVNVANPPLQNPPPVPVRRLKPIRHCTEQINAKYRSHPSIKGTVWENYQLVMTQWPRTPALDENEFRANFSKAYPVGAGNPSPSDTGSSAISNLAMETTAQFQQQLSCMKCHFNAGKFHRTEFVWTLPLRAFRDEAASRQDRTELNELLGSENNREGE